MDRRTFVLLSGSAMAGLTPTIRPAGRGWIRGSADGRLRFQLDAERRWSLWYHGDGQPVPLLRGASLGAWIGDRLVTLSDLEDTVTGTRQPPGGDAVVVRGRAAGVYLEAEFYSGDAAPAARAAVTLSIYPDRTLPTVAGIRFFDGTPVGAAFAHVNGYHSWNTARVVAVNDRLGETVSHGAVGFTRLTPTGGSAGLGFGFETGEPGEARIVLTGTSAAARSDWLPGRPVRVQGDSATMRICYHPDADGLTALHDLFMPRSLVDRDRLAAAAAPAGWCSWYELFGGVTEADMVANLEFCAAHFDPRHFRYIQLDDGYQRATGDWDTNDKFPHGHRWLTDQIHARGLLAGLWTAPFAVTDRSGVPAAHADWLLRDEHGQPIVCDTREDWGGRVFALDGAHPGAQQWLTDLARRVTREWRYDYLKIDFLLWATQGASHYGGATHAEAYRAGLAAVREGLGDAFLLGCGAPLQHAVGVVDGMRIGGDVDASWGGLQGPARAAALRSFYHRTAWLNDPDCLVVRAPLTEDEARTWTTVVAMAGGVTLFSDNLPKLPPERVPLLQRTIPVAPVPGQPVGTARDDRERAPALVAGETVIPIEGTWKLATGDEAAFAAADYDDAAWAPVSVPSTWSPESYDGVAWYRGRFTLPAAPRAAAGGLFLDLGKIDDADETFLNGVKIGQSGAFPPDYRSAWNSFRRYAVPPEAVKWGGENVLAIRAYDGGGPGGFWSTRRDRPARTWIASGGGVPDWWTVALVNWDDDPRELSIALAELGLTGPRYHAYDVWQDAPLPDVTTGRLAATVAPHATLTVALRAAVTRPQIIGSSRHVIQGAVDVADETWDAATRTLSARAVNLDGRGYRVTIAVPRTLRAGECTAERACTVTTTERHVVLEWAPDADRQDLRWSLAFIRRQGNR